MDKLHFLADTLYTLHEMPISFFQDGVLTFSTFHTSDGCNPLIEDTALFPWLADQYPGSPSLISENGRIFYGLCQNSRKDTFVTGPFSLSALTWSEQLAYKEKHGLTSHREFMIFIDKITAAASVLSVLNLEMNGTRISADDIIRQLREHTDAPDVKESDLFFYNLDNIENQKKHITYAQEKSMVEAFSSGDPEILNDFFNPTLLNHVGQLAVSPYKQLEYTVVSGIHFYTRATIESGVAPLTAYNISDLALQKTSVCTTELELLQVMANAKTSFFNAVKEAREVKQNYRYIEQSKQYIASHLYTRFTLDDVAASIGINKCYLSSHFSRHEGKTMIRYIQEERIRAAQNMLRYSDLPISVIANYLCFDSQSHMGSVFRKITGTTPAVYRTEHQTENFHS